jgi:mRNA-degrading endonuclease RelE of RelBE toxin-antitoxin system
MTYTVLFDDPVFDELDQLPANYKRRIFDLIKSLATDPFPAKSKQLEDPLDHLYRIRLDKWRVVYEVDEAEKTVVVVRVMEKTGPESYEGLAS